MPLSSTSRRGTESDAVRPAQWRTVRDPGAVATDDRGHERQGQLVDDAGGEGRSEQRRPALAEHVAKTALGQRVEREC